ncbi:hypothetical protein LTR49_027271 [Elasticomyces elasticus]|nr:hypothetical protein LTR49_027271 [Elasticomyces elasticus]
MLDPTYSQPGKTPAARDFDVTASDKNIPLGRAVILNDVTVPEKQHISERYGDKQLIQQYPDHTRVVTRAHENVCTLAYAVTLPGARRILYELGVRNVDGAYDIMLKEMCDGQNGRRMRTCLSVQPMLFQHHRPIAARSSFSDIGKREEYSQTAFRRNIRWITRVNFPKLSSPTIAVKQ